MFVFVFLSFRFFSFSSCHFGGHWIFFGVRGAFALVDFESFLFYYFEFPKFWIFLLVILWVFKKIYVKFHKGGKGVFIFLLVNFERFLFLYFEVSKSLIFFLSFWGSSNFCVKFHKWGNRGMCLFFMWILKVFCFCILKFWSL